MKFVVILHEEAPRNGFGCDITSLQKPFLLLVIEQNEYASLEAHSEKKPYVPAKERKALLILPFFFFYYSARTRSSNLMSTPNTPAMSPASLAMGAETVMQSAPVIFEV